VILATALYAACADTPEVLVFAAASLTDALGAVAAHYEKVSNDRIVLSFASSSALARQTESGAPADIYASANVQWMDYLEQRNFIRAETRTVLLSNRLVLIAPADSRIEQAPLAAGLPLAAWLDDGRLAMGNLEHVPAGRYGKQALKSLKVWKSVRRKVARTDDVRTALALVAIGEAPRLVSCMKPTHLRKTPSRS
jgi:molybdate transport system substrate-binding protein